VERAFARPAERFEHNQARAAETGVAEQARQHRRRRAVRGQRDHGARRLEMRARKSSAGVQGDQRRLRQCPAEPCRRQVNADSAGTKASLGIDVARQHGADAMHEGIAGGEHADCTPPLRQHLFGHAVERRRPWPRRAADDRCRQRQMPVAAEHDRGAAHQPARDRAQSIDPILADADDGQPAR
jgi:hypothetical protein